MGRGQSLKLATVFGIRIGVDPSWFLVLFLIIWLLSGYYKEAMPGSGSIMPFALATISALLFFLSIVLHELGHALVAIRNKIGISGIDLWMFGGVAKMTRDTDSPGVEFKVAVAGPLVTVVIALACAGIGIAVSGADSFWDAMIGRPQALQQSGLAVLSYLASINAIVFAFNLIPAFPLDGGRIARSIAWKISGNRTSATRFAAQLGRLLSYVMIGLGILSMVTTGDLIGGLWLVFIGFFLGQAARSAEYQTAITARIEGVSVADVMEKEPVAIPFNMTVDEAMEQFFFRYRYPWFPVIDARGRYIGYIEKGQMDSIAPDLAVQSPVFEIMTRDHEGRLRVSEDEKLEALLGNDALAKVGALMAVDAGDHLRGIVTVDHIRRALQAGGFSPAQP